MIKVLFASILALLLSACHSQEPKPTKTQPQTTLKNTKPKWINNPNIDGYQGAVGVVKLMKNKKKQEYIAKQMAISELMNQKSVTIKSNFTADTSSDANKAKSVIEESTQGIRVEDIVKKADYSDGKNYYIWMVIKR